MNFFDFKGCNPTQVAPGLSLSLHGMLHDVYDLVSAMGLDFLSGE